MQYTHEDYHHFELQPDDLALIARGERYLTAHYREVSGTHSPSEYFQIILAHSIKALRDGSYGSAAAVVEEEDGLEMIFAGIDTFVLDGNPQGLAELNALDTRNRFRDALQEKDTQTIVEMIEKGDIHQFSNDLSVDPIQRVLRPAAQTQPQTTLYTTFEPSLLPDPNLGINHVAMRESTTYIPGELQELLVDMFEKTRENIDLKIISAFSKPETSALAQPIIQGLVDNSASFSEI